jgi:long-chain acyl-CoA synthetase
MTEATLPTGRLRLHDIARQHARSRPTDLALGDGPVRLTWQECAARAERAAAALHAAGVGPGDRVLWLGQNSFRVQELLLACSRLGAMLCPANWRMAVDELAFVIDDLAPTVVITQAAEIGDTVTEALRTAAHRAALELQHDQPVGDADAYEAWLDGAASTCAAPDDTAPDDPLLLIGTAAFAGRPNFAMLPHRAIVAQALYMAPLMGVDAAHRYLNAGPLFHVGVFMENFATFVAGGTNVFVRRVDGDDLCRAITDFACTSGYVMGPMIDAIVAANHDGRYDLSTMRGERGNAEYDAWVQPDRSAWGRNAGGYGQTETMGMQTFNLLAERDAIGSHGRPSPLVEVRVVDPDDVDVPVGETGEIVVRGVTVMCGYWNRPELNAERSRNGWHHTNDLGRYERDGSFTFVGPKGRMLKSAAENIYPIEVENALRSHPAVADAAIIGVPDDVWVQSVKAIVVLRDGARATAEELIEHCRSKIASYKKPRTVEFVDALPRVGWAVDYDALDARFGGGSYPGGTTRST